MTALSREEVEELKVSLPLTVQLKATALSLFDRVAELENENEAGEEEQDNWETDLSMMKRRAEAAEAQVARLEAALKPFAQYMGDRMDLDNKGAPLPDDQGVGWVYLTHADFRRARAVLGET